MIDEKTIFSCRSKSVEKKEYFEFIRQKKQPAISIGTAIW